MSTCELPRKAEHEEQSEGNEDAMSRVENGLIIVGNGIRRSDILTVHNPVYQNACASELEDEDAKPLEAVDGL